jgi:hypothetical protein
MAGPSRKLKQPPPIVLRPNDTRHAKVRAQLTDDRPSEIDGETYLRWLETGEGNDPCRDSSD